MMWLSSGGEAGQAHQSQIAAEDCGEVIYALASGIGRAAIAAVRLSGAGTDKVLHRLAGALPPPRRASLRRLRSSDGVILDRAVMLWLPGPGSFTGEDCGELHLHGGRAVVAAVIAELGRAGARPAEPGEFSRRAFLNGRIDLTAAEGIADLIDAETEAQRRQALRQVEGGLLELCDRWATELRRLLAWQEALIDFADEELPAETDAEVIAGIAALATELREELAAAPRAKRLRQGLSFVICGPPNVGKSSLMNALAGRDVAIVASEPGTTRDTIEAQLDLAGVPVTLIDTAGLREDGGIIEREGMRRAEARAAEADLVIMVHAPDAIGDIEMPTASPIFHVWNKADLGPSPAPMLGVSARTAEGLADLRAALCQSAAELAGVGQSPSLTRERHRVAVSETLQALEAAQLATLVDIRAEELRHAMTTLGRITGRVNVEDLLDTIFTSFCIGK